MKQLWHLPSRFVSTTHSVGRALRRDVVGLTPVQIRVVLDGLSRLHPGPFDVHFEYVKMGEIQVGCIRKKGGKPKGGVFLVHGGGFAFGSARTHRALASHLVRLTDMEVWIPEYRLAPECPFPAGLDDLQEIYSRFEDCFSSRFIAGDSAGGNMAVACLQRLLNSGAKRVHGLLLMSPWVDLRPSSDSNRQDAHHWSPFDRLDMLEYATHYLGDQLPSIPEASPIMGSFSNFPSTYIEVSKEEFLFPDSLAIKKAMLDAGVDVTWREETAALHAWQLFPDLLPEAKRSLSEMASFVVQQNQKNNQ
jgi:epsilon-lactone hydrolase